MRLLRTVLCRRPPEQLRAVHGLTLRRVPLPVQLPRTPLSAGSCHGLCSAWCLGFCGATRSTSSRGARASQRVQDLATGAINVMDHMHERGCTLSAGMTSATRPAPTVQHGRCTYGDKTQHSPKTSTRRPSPRWASRKLAGKFLSRHDRDSLTSMMEALSNLASCCCLPFAA